MNVAPTGIVIIQEAKILLIELMSKCSYPFAKPTPMTPPTKVCVVDIGKPR